MQEIEIKHRKPNINKLLAFGFVKDGDGYVYTCDMPEINMTATARIFENRLYTWIYDSFSGEEYVLHGVASATGTFVGAVKKNHQSFVDKIIEVCYNIDAFKEKQSRDIVEYIRRKYSDEPEYLWEDTPDNAIWRRTDNQKWYAAMLTVSKAKLGLNGDGVAEIINLKAPPETVQRLLTEDGILPAYHMNKKHWYTVVLDGALQESYIFELIDQSYAAVKVNKTKRRNQT